ncbi:PIN domain-containing protein [Terriglobus saanensis]|uniref:PIN domain-containing protein n=1 Tax=Terriglobus saanensis (strain ATCC BAA-1853 / DSM 23119 / SP1PR4) TaxID=401053 RepID=E8V1J0_TERSS|nr:PIN domain-containing protein [Terriglobus saanensis]ADV81185.1 hypothetical protein AciPR4_0350 [Terriglobus saanensis SP1PR4]
MSNAVLDTSAVLALLDEEPGSDIVQELLFDAAISTVSLAEIYTKLATRPKMLARLAKQTGLRPSDL